MSNNREDRLRNMEIPKLLARLSVPAIFAMFINALYNFVDAIFVGQALGAQGIAALSIAFPIQMIIAAVGLMFGIGGASMASRFFGAGKKEEANHTFGSAIAFVGFFAVTSFTLIRIFLDPVLTMLGATENILPVAREYTSILLIGFIPLSLTMTMNNFTRAEGNAKMSMLIMLSGALTNITLDPILIFALDMGIAGAAWASVIGQVLAFAIAAIYIFGPSSAYSPRLRHFKPKLSITVELASLGLPVFLRQTGASLMVIVLNNLVKNFADDPGTLIAIIGVVNRLMMFSLMPMFGIVQGMQPIAGYNYGARQYDRVKQVVKYAAIWAVTIGAIFLLLFQIAPTTLMKMFGDDPGIIEQGPYYLRIIFAMLPLAALQIVFSSYFQALGKALPAFLLSTSRQVFILIPLVLLFTFLGGLRVMPWAFPVSDISATVITMWWFFKDQRKLFTMHEQHGR